MEDSFGQVISYCPKRSSGFSGWAGERSLDHEITKPIFAASAARIVPDCCGEEGAEPEGEALDLPADPALTQVGGTKSSGRSQEIWEDPVVVVRPSD